MTANQLALGVDLGSHGARAVVVDGEEVVAETAAEYGPPRPPARRPADAWWDAFARAVRDIEAPVRRSIRALATTGVRGAVVGVDRVYAPVTPGYPDFDPDAVAPARALIERYGDDYLARTACFAFPLAGLPKMMLHAQDERIHAWLGPQDFITALLTGRTTLSAASAFRFGILRADTMDIDRELLEEVGVESRTVPSPIPVGRCSATTAGPRCEALGLAEDVPVISAPGDVPAALYAVAGTRSGCAFVNLGTSIVATTVADSVVSGMSCDVLPDGHRAVETGRGAGVVTLEWCAALLGTAAEDLDALAATAQEEHGLRLEPDLLDPWGDGRGGTLRGIVPESGRAELAAATLAAVAGAASDAVDELIDGVGALDAIVLGGGASNCALVVDRLARLRAETVVVAAGRELAAEGAAAVARRALETSPAP